MITKAIEKLIPGLYANENKKPSDIKVPVKFFNPCGKQTWYITEANLETGEAFGWCDLGPDFDAELGYVDLNELFGIKLRFGLKIERDMHWNPNTRLSDVMNGKAR